MKIVDWYDDTHVARVSDHYNKYGFMYAKTIFNKKVNWYLVVTMMHLAMKKWLRTL